MTKISTLVLSLVMASISVKAQIPSYVPSTNLVAWYSFDNNANDLSGNGNNLTNTNAVATADRFGQPNSAYQFNGTAYLTKSSISQTFNLTGVYTFSFWGKKDVAGTGIAMMSGNTSTNNFVWLFQGDASNIFRFGTNKQGSSWTWLDAPVVTVNQWEHYVGVYNNKVMKLYKNGAYIGTVTNNYTSVSQSAMPLWIGRGAGTSNFYQGALDDIGIWNRELTVSEIQQLYQSSLSVNDVKLQKFTVAPNPASDYVIVKTKNNSSFNYKISDQTGRTILQGDSNNTIHEKIDIKSLPKGVYYLQINKEAIQKLIKN